VFGGTSRRADPAGIWSPLPPAPSTLRAPFPNPTAVYLAVEEYGYVC
jgi:hypothetical protein